MRNLIRVLSGCLSVVMLMTSMPVFAEDLQELQIMDVVSAKEDSLQADMAALEDETPIQQEMILEELPEISEILEETLPAEEIASLADLPAIMENAADEILAEATVEIPAETQESIEAEFPAEENIDEQSPAEDAAEGEIPAQEAVSGGEFEELVIAEAAEPVFLPAVEYIMTAAAEGAAYADLSILLPEAATPVVEIEGLICDADYFMADGALNISGAWLSNQQGDEITLTIYGADMLTYIQPVTLMTMAEEEMQLMNSGEYDVSNLFINGVCVADNDGQWSEDGWRYDNHGVLDLSNNNTITITGSGRLKVIDVDRYSGTIILDSVDITCTLDSAIILNGGVYDVVHQPFYLVGDNVIRSAGKMIGEGYGDTNRSGATFSGTGSLTGGAITCREVNMQSGTLNVSNITGILKMSGGTVNVNGGERTGVGKVEISDGTINITRSGDGLEYQGIGGVREMSGGRINVRLSGSGDFTGMHIAHHDVYAREFSGGTVNVEIEGAKKASGVRNQAELILCGTEFNVKLRDTQETAVGWYSKNPTAINDGSINVEIDGAMAAQGADISQTELLIDGGALNIDIKNTTSSMVYGLLNQKPVVYSGKLDVQADTENPDSMALHSIGPVDLSMVEGEVYLKAGKLAPEHSTVSNMDYVGQPLNGTTYTYVDGDTIQKTASYLVVDGMKYLLDPNGDTVSGEGWSYDCAEKILYLDFFRGDSIAYEGEMEYLTVNVTGENKLQSIRLPGIGKTTITGNGSLDMASTSSKHRWAIEAGGKIRIYGVDITMKGYSIGLYAEGLVQLASGRLKISDCGYGVYSNNMSIERDAALDIHALKRAIYLDGKCLLVNRETDVSAYTEIVIDNAQVTAGNLAERLMLGGEVYYAEDLASDISGDGWRWIAAEQRLVLNGYAGSAIASSFDSLHVHAEEGMDGFAVSGKNVKLSAEPGVWMNDVEIQADALEIDSGRFAFVDDTRLVINSLIMNGGKLIVPAGIKMYKSVTAYGGELETSVLEGGIAIRDGSIRVTGTAFLGWDKGVKQYYSIKGGAIGVIGGSLYTAGPAIASAYSQSGGTVHIAADAAIVSNEVPLALDVENMFSAYGGKLIIHNAYGDAVRSEWFYLSGKINADLYGASGVFKGMPEQVRILGKQVNANAYTTLQISGKKIQKRSVDENLGLFVGNDVYGKQLVAQADLYGEGWSWDHTAKKLTISNLNADDPYIYIDSGTATLHLQGGSQNKNLEIVSVGTLNITGDGELKDTVIASAKSIKVKDCVNLKNVKFYAENTLSFDNAEGHELYFESLGNVTISKSRLVDAGGVINKNLTIKNSFVHFDGMDDNGCSGYVYGKTSISNSVVKLYGKLYSKKGTSIASDAAAFLWNWEEHCYELQKNATLSQDWVLEGKQYNVPVKRTLTIKSGKTLYLSDERAILAEGTINGNMVVLGDAQSVQISGANSLPIGGSIQLTATTMPEKNLKDVSWSTSDISLCEVDATGLVTATKDASRAGERVTITAVYEGNEDVFDTHEILLLPMAEEVVARDANGRYAQNIELWLDPANNTAQLGAKVYPYEAQQDVTWKSSNSKIVSVDENGVITAKKAGSANVYAIAADGSEVQSQKVKVTVRKAPSSIKFSTKSPTLGFDPANGTGSSVQLKVKLSSGSASTVQFTSADESIAVVDANGVVTATGAGKVKITAQTYNKKKATLTVNVKSAPESIAISDREITIGVGMSHKFTASIPKSSYGTWFFNTNNACGSVNAGTGEFLALKPGDVEVTVTTFNGKSDSCIVHVLPAPEVVVLNQNAIELGVGEKFTLDVGTRTQDGNPAMGSYTYSTSRKSVATVSAAGKITAKKVGTAKIIVTAHNGVTAECDVVVSKAPTSVKMSKTATLTFDEETGIGQHMKLEAVLSSKSASALSWKSSNKDVVTVDGQGNIVATGIGKAKITVQTFNKKTATCTVTVKAAE